MRKLTDTLVILFVINAKDMDILKKHCDKHNKNVKRISKLEFDKDIINKLMEIFNVNQKEIDQVKKEKELKINQPT